jgi:oxygen-independent coproporphyrinogen-3 oxidase
VSTVGNRRWRNTPRLGTYIDALARNELPAREVEELAEPVKRAERVMLGLRLDEGLPLAEAEGQLDADALARLSAAGLVRVRPANGVPATLVLSDRGRRLGDAVTAALLA